ncbi:MAG: rod shape-determining protein MreC [Steroidobacteraceae bacterium]
MASRQDHDHRPLLVSGPSLAARLFMLVILSGILMIADHRAGYLDALRSTLMAGLYPLQRSVDAPFSAARWLSEGLATHSMLRRENGRLAEENRELRLRQMRLDALERENARLREASQTTARVIDRYLVAELVRVEMDRLRHRVLVNRGSTDGVYVGQPALDAQGVFGQVTRVGPVSAEVIMISDPAHALPVAINRTGMRTIAYGRGTLERIELPFLPGNADIEPGDLVVTSGLGGVFPPGYPVGEVEELLKEPGEQGLRVTVRPLARLSSDPEVLLAWYDNQLVEPVAPMSPNDGAEVP